MSIITTVRFEDRTDPRLGRHQVHDERSWAYRMAEDALPTKEVLHERHIPILDQGKIGSCTANAGLGMISTGPLWKSTDPVWTEDDAVTLYGEETRLDDEQIPGHYPPDDTGSSGLYLCKALQQRKLIESYWHAFTLRALLAKLAVQPCAIGIPWFNSMFEPDRNGLVDVRTGSGRAGAHEVCADGIDPRHQLVRFPNSWSPSWGDHGYGWLSFMNLGWLLSQGGDAVTVNRL